MRPETVTPSDRSPPIFFDAASFLAEIQEDPLLHGAEGAQRGLELVPAVAAQRADGVSREAFGMQPDGDALAVRHVPVHERRVLLPVPVVPERHHLEMAEAGRQLRDGRDPHADVVFPDSRAIVIAVFV